MTNIYSFVFMLDGEAEIPKLREIISTFKGTIKDEKKMGSRALAYPINKREKADYHEWTIEMPMDAMGEFKKKLGYEDDLIRYLLLSKED